MKSRVRIVALFALSTVLVGCARKDTDKSEDRRATMPFDRTAAEAAIRKNDEDFFAGVKARDANALAATYANDAVSMPEYSPPLVGRDAIRKYNQELVKLPQLAMTGGSERIRFSDDGSMAYDAGNYSVSYADAKGHAIKDEGKYLNVLKKVDGQWEIVVDAFSSNRAPPK